MREFVCSGADVDTEAALQRSTVRVLLYYSDGTHCDRKRQACLCFASTREPGSSWVYSLLNPTYPHREAFQVASAPLSCIPCPPVAPWWPSSLLCSSRYASLSRLVMYNVIVKLAQSAVSSRWHLCSVLQQGVVAPCVAAQSQYHRCECNVNLGAPVTCL